MQKFIIYPFATAGTKTEIADTTTLDGTVSYQEGYGAAYSQPTSSPTYKPIARSSFNGILYDVTTAIQELQKGAIPAYITATLNGGTAFSYPVNALVTWTDGNVYVNTVANNTSDPATSGWNLIDFKGLSLVKSANGTIATSSAVSAVFEDAGLPSTGVISIKIANLLASALDFGEMEVYIFQDDNDHSSLTNPPLYKFIIKGNMNSGVWYNCIAVSTATNATSPINVRFTRDATHGYVEIGETTSTWYKASVVVKNVTSQVVAGYTPTITVSLQNSLLGTVATDFTISTSASIDLSSAQTVSGIKTFLNGSIKINNAGATNAYTLKNGGASNQDYDLANPIPFCAVYQSTAQTLGTSFAVLNITAIEKDANTWWDTANNRFKPTRAGWYECYAQLYNAGVTTFVAIQLYKNGTTVMALDSQSGANEVAKTSKMVYLNGSTDYIQVRGATSAGCALQTGSAYTYFHATFIGETA